MKLKERTPPRWASRLFEWYGRNMSIEDLQGDMDELFQHNLSRMSPSRAKFEYNRQVISLLFSYALQKRKKQSGRQHHTYSRIHLAMIKSNLKITCRNMLKNKFS
ncbi:MAG: hypothetical protein C0490_09635, partial [Marivirga sp.]|nr:hypothetical protein [Marivirga sp.]